jgi:ribosomal protein L11 methyltransferase
LFQPVEYSDFVFYGDHIKNHLKFKKNMIRLNSADAFGSGSHPTTKGCINIFNYLQKKFFVEKFLDIGCGSGILSICAYKYWHPSKILAVDIERNSILRSKLNAKNNNLNNLLRLEHTNGIKVLKNNFYTKFDLIVANIISSELIKLAQDIAKYLGDNCYLVLSGILKSQENSIISKFKNFNLLLVKKQYVENWVTILMIKKDKIN